MASASSSSTQEKYDVFLSFRGEDTRNGFTSHLNAALCQKKIITFMDDELRRGDEISPSLLKAIEGSKISIVIFSEDYASSRWCLEELVKIMDCKKMHGQIVIPVFYQVNPSDVRKQSGTYGDAFANHEGRYQLREEMLQRWRSALTDAANLSGFHSNVFRLESEFIEKIVEDVLKRLNIMSSSYNKNLVGMEMKIQKIKSLLSIGTNEVCKVGIWGMGGIGKTTLANVVFNEISRQFEGSYFIQNVREESEKRGLIQLQEKILSTILGDEHHNIRHASTIEGLRRKKVLFVFDDVTHLNQINELIGDLENLGSGSYIIITTRDKQVLASCRVDNAAICEVEGLYNDESFRLFSQHAFKQNHHINEDFMVLSNRVISYAKGVPLALKVLGSFLLDRGKHEWESTLEKLKNCPHQDIQTVLKISYDGLDNEEKDLFLDVACFFNGWEEHLVCKFSSSIGLRVLIDKALITISYKTIRVHDLLQEMGMEIVRQESINKPGQRSRLWQDNDVYNVLKKNKGTDNIRGIRFDISKMREIHLKPHAFSELDYLRFLIVNQSNYRGNNNNVHGFEDLECDFTELRCLYWDSYPFTSLPLKLYPQNLVVLMMRRNNLEQLWSGIKDLANIKYINLSNSKHLLKVPDLSEAQNLECLILENCASLFEITAPSQNLDKLVYLNLRNCESLINLPIGIQSKSLRDVILSGCSSFNTAPRISCNMEQLCLDGTAIKALSSSIDYPSRLVGLNLKGCSALESLPSSVCNLNSLGLLILSGFSNLKFVLGIPPNIKELHLDGTAIKDLPSSIENASSLVILSLKDCSSLESLPDGICRLTSLKYLCISGCSKLDRLPKDIGNLHGLEVLKATGNSDCLRLESLPSSVCNLNSLRQLNLSGISNLKMVLGIPCKIEELYLDGTAIKELPSSIENVSSLVILDLRNCSSLESLPNGICKLKSLKHLYISGCLKLDRLPEDIGDLESLEVLEANGITIREVPSSMGRLKNLHDLSFVGCKNQELVCSLSPIFPDLLFLRRLNLNYCGLTELPNNLGDLSSLTDLNLDGNNFESLPTSIINLSALYQLTIRFCNRLQSLPKLLGNMHKVNADGCKLLKVLSGFKIPSDGYCKGILSFVNCSNLDFNAVGKILIDALLKKYADRTVRFEKNLYFSTPYSMVFPGSEIPEWFDIQSNGFYIELPRGSFNHKLLGFVCCIILESGNRSRFRAIVKYELILKLQNRPETLQDSEMVSVESEHIKSDHVVVGYNIATSKFRGFNCNAEVNIYFSCSTWSIKKCGVRLLFSQEFGDGIKRSRCSIIDEEEAHSNRLKSSNYLKEESSSRENFGLWQGKVMSEVEEQVVSNNNVNSGCNKVESVGVGGVAVESIVQQSQAAAAGVGNERRMRHGRGNGHNIVVGNAGGYGRGNMQGMGNRGLAGPMWNRGPGAVGGGDAMGKGGNGFGQGIGEALPLMYPQSIGFDPRFGGPMGWMGSYGGFLGAPTPPFSTVLSKCSIIDEEEAHANKRLKSSNLFKGESSSRENFELGQSKAMSEVEEQVMSNNNVNVAYNKVDGVGVGVGGVALGSIEQQSHAGGGGVGNEGRMRHERGNGHNIVVGNAGGYGRGNMQGMGNRALSGPMWNRGPGAVGGRGMIGNGGNGFGQGIDGDPPLMHPHSIGFGPGFGAPMGRMGSYGGFLGAPSPPFSGESSSSTQLDVKRSGVHLVLPYVEEGEEINPSTNESSSFNFLDLDEFPQDFVRSDPFTPLDSDEFPQGCVRSHPFTPLDSDEFPQVPVASHTCTPLDSDEFPQGFVRSHPFTPLDSDEFPQVPVASDEDE